MDLSIIVASWNTRKMTHECLDSVFRNLGELSCEVIVVDNASTDGSADMIATDFPQVILVRNPDNVGFASANNQAVRIAVGRQILLLNTDTIVRKDVLSASVVWLDAHADVGAMGCRVLNTDETVQMTCAMYPSLLNLLLLTSGAWKLRWPRMLGRGQMTHWQRDSEREVEMITGCYLLVRREVIDQIGLLDEAFFFFGEETDWCQRMREAGWKLMFAPVGEIIHHGGGSVKQLNHRRDVMLSQATVLLHKKHAGMIGAVAAFIVLTIFNGSRAIFWTIVTVFKRNQKTTGRARHFRAVFKDSRQIWPEAGK